MNEFISNEASLGKRRKRGGNLYHTGISHATEILVLGTVWYLGTDWNLNLKSHQDFSLSLLSLLFCFCYMFSFSEEQLSCGRKHE